MGQPELQALLETLAPNVYFQTPANIAMQYPAIRYEWDDEDVEYAGNRPYRRQKRYQVTVITREPDSDIPEKVADLPLSSFDRRFVAANLYHTVYNLYF